MLQRAKEKEIQKYLRHFPVVAIIGPRQCGKSTLAKSIIGKGGNAVYLDLENPDDRARLTEPSLFFEQHTGKLICLDEVQFTPDIFSIIRSTVDINDRNGRFLLLGSASPALLRQSSESLAGRIIYVELAPFSISEIKKNKQSDHSKLWLRGGFPRSYLAEDEQLSMTWRKNFILTFLERDVANFGVGISPENLRRFWMMCAHLHGQLMNFSAIGKSLGVSHTTVRHYFDIMQSAFMLTWLQPYHANVSKRLVKTPKVYISDSGILHALLNIGSKDELAGHPASGYSWEGFVVAQLLTELKDWEAFFISTSTLNEIDLILKKGKRLVGVECKLSKSPALGKGFYQLMQDLKIREAYVACPVNEPFHLSKEILAADIRNIISRLS